MTVRPDGTSPPRRGAERERWASSWWEGRRYRSRSSSRECSKSSAPPYVGLSEHSTLSRSQSKKHGHTSSHPFLSLITLSAFFFFFFFFSLSLSLSSSHLPTHSLTYQFDTARFFHPCVSPHSPAFPPLSPPVDAAKPGGVLQVEESETVSWVAFAVTVPECFSEFQRSVVVNACSEVVKRRLGVAVSDVNETLCVALQFASLPPLQPKTFMSIDLGASKLTVSAYELVQVMIPQTQTDRQTDRQTDSHTHTHTHTPMIRSWL